MTSSVPRHAPMTALIVDDEDNRQHDISLFLQTYYPDVEIVAEVSSVSSARKLIQEAYPEAAVLDLQPTGENNAEQAYVLQNQDVLVVFVPPEINQSSGGDTTKYVLRLIRTEDLTGSIARLQLAFDRLLETRQAMNRDIGTSIAEGEASQNGSADGKIVLPTSEGLIVQATSEIIRLESDNYYTTVVRKNAPSILLTKTLKDFEAVLDSEEFLRVHNSHIINIGCLERFDKRDGGYVVMCDSSRVPVSRRRQRLLLERLQRYRHV